MKLTGIEITDYKSIRRSDRIEIGDVTCFVGKNEAGKTALLQAVYRLNPIVPEHDTFDVTDDYPRSDVEDYRQQVETGDIDPTIVIKATYAIETNEVQEVEAALGEGVLKNQTLTLSKGYENCLLPELSVNESVAVKRLIDESNLPDEIQTGAAKLESLQDLSTFLESKGAEYAAAVQEAKQRARAMPDGEPKQKALANAALYWFSVKWKPRALGLAGWGT
jgi:predicted ATP-dependent endonuclease of OLD family